MFDVVVFEAPESSVEFLCLAWRNDAVWFLCLVLKSFSLSPMSLRVTVAWWITDDYTYILLCYNLVFLTS